MRKNYTIRGREEGRGPAFVHRYATLAELQTYIKDRWQGVEYIDGPRSFHTDYVAYEITGATLADFGHRRGPAGTDEYWEWEWKDVNVRPADKPKEE
jgi:hypothetical protein